MAEQQVLILRVGGSIPPPAANSEDVMKEGDIVAHGRYPGRVGYVTGVEHASHGPIVSYSVRWLNGAHKGEEHKISAWRIIDMQRELERTRQEVTDREEALAKWRHEAFVERMGFKV